MKGFFQRLISSIFVDIIKYAVSCLVTWFLSAYAVNTIDLLGKYNTYAWLNYPYHHPFRFIAFSVVVCLFVKLAVVAYGKYRYFQNLERVVINSGLESFWDNTSNERDQATQYCRQQIENYGGLLQIMGCTGWETFAKKGSPFYEVMQNYQGPIQVLLCDPKSTHLNKRAYTLQVPVTHLQEEIHQACVYLQELNNRRANTIELKLYHKDPPIWKMLISGQFLWLQYYKVKTELHVADTPIYGFYGNEESSLYYPLAHVFSKRWNESKNYKL